jgi:hypothetical protein
MVPALAAGALLCTACGSGGQPSAGDDGPDLVTPTTDSAVPLSEASAPPGDAGLSDVTAHGDGNAEGGSDARSDAPPPPAPVCVTSYAWTAGREWIPDAIARFAGVSATGLTVAWTRTNGDIVVADRLGEQSDFEPPVVAPVEQLQDRARLALDPSGTLLAGVAPNETDFVVLRRPSTAGVIWKSAAPDAFARITTAAQQAGAGISEPVLGASGDVFFYLLTPGGARGGGDAGDAGDDAGDAGDDAGDAGDGDAALAHGDGPSTLYEARWDATSMQWNAGVALTNPELASADGTHRRRPTGASSDDRTLFFFDEVTGVERAAWRDAPALPFTHFEDLPATPEAAPNADCSVLYFRGQSLDAGTQGVTSAQ